MIANGRLMATKPPETSPVTSKTNYERRQQWKYNSLALTDRYYPETQWNNPKDVRFATPARSQAFLDSITPPHL
jgi:hypothetical protein